MPIQYTSGPIGNSAGRRVEQVFLVGGGIASLAAAAFMIREGQLLGQKITIFEEMNKLGGALDGAGSPEQGYVLRGGRMIERNYLCTYDLFSSIPTLDGSGTVTQEIFAWNEMMKTSSNSRLVRDGKRETAPEFGLREMHILTLEWLAIEPEAMLGRSRIADHFDPSFFTTNFWLMWCTTFAFQPWHSAVEFKRYLVRFAHMVAGFSQLQGIMRTKYNQYDSMVRPLQQWLAAQGVKFELKSRVVDLGMHYFAGKKTVDRIILERNGQPDEIIVSANDLVLVTLGSMTEASSFGSMKAAPVPLGKTDGGAWTLWEKLAANRPEFGRPANFSEHIDESKWLSFTTTLHTPAFLKIIRDLTGNVPGEGGLVTFPESSWLASIVVPFQPHFIGQPADVSVFWGYGLKIDQLGDFVKRPMAECSGREIMTELLGHLLVDVETPGILDTCTCIPCLMPFITSQFLRRDKGDRPPVIPEDSANLAFIGQFCELPDDVVFTVEYSVRSAQTAVYGLLGLDRQPPAVYQGKYDPRVLYRAFMALHDF